MRPYWLQGFANAAKPHEQKHTLYNNPKLLQTKCMYAWRAMTAK